MLRILSLLPAATEMVDLAGGVNIISEPGKRSKIITLHHIIASKPSILIISPCGFDVERTIKEKKRIEKNVNELPRSKLLGLCDNKIEI